jgi:hypothetical protein
MWLIGSLLTLALAGPCDAPPAPAAPPPRAEAAGLDEPNGRVVFLWFLGPEGLILNYIIEQAPEDPMAPGARPAVIFCAQVHIGVASWVGIAGDWTIDRPLMIRLPNRGIGPTFWLGTTPTFWRLLAESQQGEDAGD